jgi:heptosyltransferase-2
MNILVIKTGALGDVVRTSFLAQALKEKYARRSPQIFWLTDKGALSIFHNNPYISRVFTENELGLLHRMRFDLIVNLEEEDTYCRFTSSSSAKRKIGFLWEGGRVVPSKTTKEWFDMSLLGKKPQNDVLKNENKKTHRQLMGEIAEVPWQKYEPFLRLSSHQRLFAQRMREKYDLSSSDLVVGINTGGADRWPKALSVKKTVSLIHQISKKFGAKILLFGGPNEVQRNREIMKLVKVPVLDTGCGNDLVDFPALVSLCHLMITTDSLGLHIALALKRKTVCLVGPTSPSEIGMYDLGGKLVSTSSCVSCYQKDCKAMEKIKVSEIVQKAKSLLDQKITLLITAFKEPHVDKAIASALKQKTSYAYDVLVSAPDKETLDTAREFAKKDKRVKIFKDPGKGKSYALNQVFRKIKTDILILTDGDTWIGEDAVQELAHQFQDPEIGCATGKPVPAEDRKNKYGYWANFLFDAAHGLRKYAAEHHEFIECSGYLWAFRKQKIDSIPLDVAEDTVVPYILWEKGYKIAYADLAEVFVKNPTYWQDWIEQKTRTSKAHETLGKYVDVKTTPRVKNFKNEAAGIFSALRHPNTSQEAFWMAQLVLARLYMWIKVHSDVRLKGQHYGDGWKRVESTK